MMSNPPNPVQQRQRLHRKQNSTPVAFGELKVPSLPPSIQQPTAHRRGQSLDQQRSPIRRHHNHTGSTAVSITNLGSTPQGQQILREAQQEKVARPGQLIHTTLAPQCGLYQLNTNFTPDQTYSNASTMNAIIQNSPHLQMPHSPFYAHDMTMPMSASFDGMGLGIDENSQHYFQAQPNISQEFVQGLNDMRTMSQPDLQLYSEQRPITPTQQINSTRFPLTPATTPYKHNIHPFQYHRSAQSSPLKAYADETIKAPAPVSMQRGRSLEGIFEHRDLEQNALSPPGTAPLMSTSRFDVAEMPVPEHMAPHVMPASFSFSDSSHVSAVASPAALSPERSSFNPSPHVEQLPFFDESGGEGLSLSAKPIPVLPSSTGEPGSSSPTRAALSPRRMSISDLNLEPGIKASIEETNVTLDDIAQFIEGPDANDNKWICKFEDCNKRFGRKENIKSHVQTHLNDRQFRCDHCNKCFVRGHDLKRHAKIHTGTKPYPCLCGCAFARHDALTRHRQRGMCIGAFEGVVKKVIKRGRPRKHRPEMDERVDKATRTRKRAEERGQQYDSSSSSAYSASSWGSPPTEIMDSLSIRGGSPFNDMTLFGGTPHQVHLDSIGYPPELFTFTPPASPGFSTGNKPSPQHRALTPHDMAELPTSPTPTVPATAAAAAAASQQQHHHLSRHHTPPSLSHSSSSPAADIVAFDFSDDPTSSVQQRMGLKLDADRSGMPGADFDSFLDYGSMGLDAGADSFFDGL